MAIATILIAVFFSVGIAKETNSIIDKTQEIERLTTKTEILSSWSRCGLNNKQCTCKAPKTKESIIIKE